MSAEDDFSALVDPANTGPTHEVLGHAGRRRRRSLIPIVIIVVSLLIVAGGGSALIYRAYPDQVKSLFGWSNDYTGAGTGRVDIVIKTGQDGSAVATTLADAGVTKTYEAFYDLLLKSNPEPVLIPGTYRLASRMSAASALAALQNPASRLVAQVAIPEGETMKQILAAAAKGTGIPLAQLQSAAKDRYSGVPSDAPSLEGYLFPATYTFQPKTTAHQVLQAMVTRMIQALDAAGVTVSDRHRVLTFASIVQKEGNGSDDKKVARVFVNRMAQGIPLQSDATVSYGAGGTTVVPTQKQYDEKNGYNTYLRKGLPVGPISSPGDAAIDAVLHPATGTWLFFVTVNLATGETIFSNTDAEHERAAAQFRAWLAKHPEYGK